MQVGAGIASLMIATVMLAAEAARAAPSFDLAQAPVAGRDGLPATNLPASVRQALAISTPAAGIGVFGSYDLAPGQGAGLFRLGMTNPLGVITSTSVARADTAVRESVRLETTYSLAAFGSPYSVRLGDTVSRPGSWGRATRIGGVQFGTNLDALPGYVRAPLGAPLAAPLTSAIGVSALPSVVDVFMNSAFSSQRGPINPVQPNAAQGAAVPGALSLFATDILGRQQLINQPLYAAPAMVARGQSDYSIEAGMLREGFGLESNRYGAPAGSGLFRYGLADGLTFETRGEASASARSGGGGIDHFISSLGLLASAHAAASASDAGRGALGALGAQHRAGNLQFGARVQWASDAFRQIGMRPEEAPLARSVAFSGGLNLGALGSLSAALAEQTTHDGSAKRVFATSYSYRFGALAALSVAASRSLGIDPAVSVFVMFSLPLDPVKAATPPLASR